jgi:phosphoserine phosphatase RsbU/P
MDPEAMERLKGILGMVRKLSEDPDPISSVNDYARTMRVYYGDQALMSVSQLGLEPGSYRIMRVLHQPGVALEGFTDTFYAGANAPVHSGGFIGDLIASGEPYVNRDAHIDDDPVLGNSLAPYRMVVGVPLYFEGVNTNWVFFMNTDPDAYSDQQIEDRLMQANLMGGFTNSKRVTQELRKAHEWIEREVDEIANIQRGLLPRHMPEIEGLHIATVYETYDRAGGDYYDVFPIGAGTITDIPRHEGKWGILIADASGHGPSAAVVVAMLSALIHSFPDVPRGPGAMLAYLNHHLTMRQANPNFITAFLAILDPESGDLSYACAGHPMPLLRDDDGSVTTLTGTGGLPLGIRRGERYLDAQRRLVAGDRLLLYTDGITEALSPKGELLGETPLEQSFQAADGTVSAIMESIMKTIRHHEAGRRPMDDQTMVLVHVE